jgi:hypothetical protein
MIWVYHVMLMYRFVSEYHTYSLKEAIVVTGLFPFPSLP